MVAVADASHRCLASGKDFARFSRRQLDHAVTATQKTILGAFGADAGYIKNQIARLSNI